MVWIWIQRASATQGIRPRDGACGTCGGPKDEQGRAEDCLGDACPNREDGDAPRERPGSATAVFLLIIATALPHHACHGSTQTAEPAPSLQVEAETNLMGTRWAIRLLTEGNVDEHAARTAIDAAFAEVARVESVMSEWQPQTPISLVNAGAGGDPVPAPRELVDIVRRGLALGEESRGAFDITWRGMGDLWAVHRDDFAVPEPAAVDAARARVDYRLVGVEDDAIELPAPGMALGLGGIAKGYGIDRAAETLRSHGIESFYIDGGGDVVVAGGRGGEPWRVGVRAPRGGRTDLIGVLRVHDGAVATSGDYERVRVIDGRRYHHIIDPRTGYPTEGMWSVTVFAPTAERADALATAVFVLGAEEGLALIEAEPNSEALAVDDTGSRHVTGGFGAMFEAIPGD